ncbi:MAG: hypothetical protein ACRDL7_10965 [Gaiellaceae bacterium]
MQFDERGGVRKRDQRRFSTATSLSDRLCAAAARARNDAWPRPASRAGFELKQWPRDCAVLAQFAIESDDRWPDSGR